MPSRLRAAASALAALTFTATADLSAQSWADPPAPSRQLRGGDVVDARLVRQSRNVDGSYVDRYALHGRAGQVFTISLYSSDFDPVLRLAFLGSTTGFEDDDSGYENGARFTIRFPTDGIIVLAVMSFETRATGNYRIAVDEAINLDPRGHGAEGSLTEGDFGFQDERVVDHYTLDGRAGDVFRISLKSSDFDPIVSLFTHDLQVVAEDDDGGSGTDSEMEVRLPHTGRYYVIVAGVGTDSRGDYYLEVRPVTAANGTTIYGGGGDLSTTAGRCNTIRACDTHVFDGRAGDRVAIIARTTSFDPMVSLAAGWDGSVLGENDDDPAGGTDSRLEITLPRTGKYTVTVRAYGRQVGPYRVEVIRLP